MSRPVAVVIGDIHFSVPNLELASSSLRQALYKANALQIPLVINGDLMDTKAILRAECVNRVMDILGTATGMVYVNIGNHDLLSEKGDDHSLHFLDNIADVVKSPVEIPYVGWVIPYQNSTERLSMFLKGIKPESRLIMHQGVQGAYLGHYTQDKTSLSSDHFKNFRVVSSHYHRRQDIQCGPIQKKQVGVFSYIGNPYTLNFGEAKDPSKGFSILHADGTLKHVDTNLRKHVLIERNITQLEYIVFGVEKNDLIMMRIRGPKNLLDAINKDKLGEKLFGHSNFKLDKEYDNLVFNSNTKKSKNNHELLDELIDRTGETDSRKKYMKKFWRDTLQ